MTLTRILLLVLIFVSIQMQGQNYQALHGSNYYGALGVHNNPASAMASPYKWDLTVLGAQFKASTNILTVYNYSLLSNPSLSQYQLNSGEYKRYGKVATNLNLFNARIAMRQQQAISFGANFRSYTNVRTSNYNYLDTFSKSGSFFKNNPATNSFNANVETSSWVELYGSYARTIIDNGSRRLNAGATLKLNRGMGGGYVNLANATYKVGGANSFSISDIALEYTYSSNFDKVSKSSGSSSKVADFIKYTDAGLSFDAGIEYLLRDDTPPDFNSENDYYNYNWKIGISLLDAGFATYRPGKDSRNLNGIAVGTDNFVLDNKFDSTVKTFTTFNDSLATIAGYFGRLAVPYHILHPMRLVLNVDRHLQDDFYLNAELTINLAQPIERFLTLNVREMNLLTITPRWETQKFGAYLPVQFTNTNKLWVGGAFKAGPLLFGFHNWANIFSKTKITQGGGYLALIFHSRYGVGSKSDKRLDCPAF